MVQEFSLSTIQFWFVLKINVKKSFDIKPAKINDYSSL